MVLSATEILTEKFPDEFAEPDASSVVHAASVYSRTVLEASAVPITNGALLFLGPAGLEVERVGATGAVESSTYVTETEEHAEVVEPSVAWAQNVVLESLETASAIENAPKLLATPVAT